MVLANQFHFHEFKNQTLALVHLTTSCIDPITLLSFSCAVHTIRFVYLIWLISNSAICKYIYKIICINDDQALTRLHDNVECKRLAHSVCARVYFWCLAENGWATVCQTNANRSSTKAMDESIVHVFATNQITDLLC